MSEEKKRGRPRKLKPAVSIAEDGEVRYRKPFVRIDVGEDKPTRRRMGPGSTATGKAARVAEMDRRREVQAPPQPAPPPRKRGRKQDPPHHLRTTVDKVENPYAAVGGMVRVEVRHSLDVAMRRLKCERGEHARLFVRDWEMIGSALRSIGFDGGGGSGFGQAFPAARVDAAGRLRDLRLRIGSAAYDLCEAYLCRGLSVQQIHAAGGEQHVVVSAMIREAVNALAEFYTPGRTRPNRTHAAVTRLLAEIERTV